MELALESTLITHGFPSPTNLEVAFALEKAAREEGCRPKTIGVLAGEIKVGLNEHEIRALAEQKNVVKAGVRELPVVVAQRLWASTTVSATMHIADIHHIPVFATGGIGGVHYGKWDVSQDIIELAKTRMIVVSAGPKAILDLCATQEMLETFGVTTVGFQVDEMPAFYSRSSGLSIQRVSSPQEIAEIYRVKKSLDLGGALLVFNPVPTQYEINNKEVEEWVAKANSDLEEARVTGKQVTPFLLSRMAVHSSNRTILSNIRLLENNVRLGCKIALALTV